MEERVKAGTGLDVEMPSFVDDMCADIVDWEHIICGRGCTSNTYRSTNSGGWSTSLLEEYDSRRQSKKGSNLYVYAYFIQEVYRLANSEGGSSQLELFGKEAKFNGLVLEITIIQE